MRRPCTAKPLTSSLQETGEKTDESYRPYTPRSVGPGTHDLPPQAHKPKKKHATKILYFHTADHEYGEKGSETAACGDASLCNFDSQQRLITTVIIIIMTSLREKV
jgi:hypothetical protein